MHCFLFLLFSRPPRPLQSITKAAKLDRTFCRHFSILNSVSNNATDFALALLDRQPLKIWFLFKLVLKLFSSQSGPRLALQQNINITSPGHASGQHLWWQLGLASLSSFYCESREKHLISGIVIPGTVVGIRWYLWYLYWRILKLQLF